jgi:hypothetical protein
MVRLHRPPEPEIPFDQQRLTDATVTDDLDQRPVGREESAPDRLHQEQSPVRGLLDHPGGLSRVERERLLAQDVLPGTQEGQGIRFVARLRRGDVHDVHIRIGSERLVIAVPGRDGEPVAEIGGTFGRA